MPRNKPQVSAPDCVFCDVDRIDKDGWFEFWPGGGGMAFTPLNPVTPGHILVVPRQHVADALEDPDVTAETMRQAANYARRARAGGRWSAFNIITSAGHDATQTVMHLHLHVVPRRPGDGLRLPWSPDAPQ